MDRTEQWFKAFKAEADAFDIYGTGCAADDNAKHAKNDKEKEAWRTIIEHCRAIEGHIDAIKAFGKF